MIYFGQIYEYKGIEDFIDTIRLLRVQNNNLPCAIIGALGDANTPIVKLIRKMAGTLDIELKFNLPPEKVADEFEQFEYSTSSFSGRYQRQERIGASLS